MDYQDDQPERSENMVDHPIWSAFLMRMIKPDGFTMVHQKLPQLNGLFRFDQREVVQLAVFW